MPEKLKDTLISPVQVLKLAEAISSVYPEFKPDEFIRLVLDSDWTDRELKQKNEAHHRLSQTFIM